MRRFETSSEWLARKEREFDEELARINKAQTPVIWIVLGLYVLVFSSIAFYDFVFRPWFWGSK